jgi:hypothetical protein
MLPTAGKAFGCAHNSMKAESLHFQILGYLQIAQLKIKTVGYGML